MDEMDMLGMGDPPKRRTRSSRQILRDLVPVAAAAGAAALAVTLVVGPPTATLRPTLHQDLPRLLGGAAAPVGPTEDVRVQLHDRRRAAVRRTAPPAPPVRTIGPLTPSVLASPGAPPGRAAVAGRAGDVGPRSPAPVSGAVAAAVGPPAAPAAVVAPPPEAPAAPIAARPATPAAVARAAPVAAPGTRRTQAEVSAASSSTKRRSKPRTPARASSRDDIGKSAATAPTVPPPRRSNVEDAPRERTPGHGDRRRGNHSEKPAQNSKGR